jgi:hypothetical protein
MSWSLIPSILRRITAKYGWSGLYYEGDIKTMMPNRGCEPFYKKPNFYVDCVFVDHQQQKLRVHPYCSYSNSSLKITMNEVKKKIKISALK